MSLLRDPARSAAALPVADLVGDCHAVGERLRLADIPALPAQRTIETAHVLAQLADFVTREHPAPWVSPELARSATGLEQHLG